MRNVGLVLVLGFLGCNPNADLEGDALPQLEAFAVTAPTDTHGEMVSGSAKVSGADKDWVLTITDGADKDFVYEIHSPSGLDLGRLDGKTGVEVEVFYDLSVSMVVSDAAGPLYIANGGGGDYVLPAGWAGVAKLGPTQVIHEDVAYTSALFGTDDGEVELLPGEGEVMVVDARAYEVGLIGAQTWVDQRTPAEHHDRCAVQMETLAFEALLTAAPEEPVVMKSPVGAGMKLAGCGG